jgi:hypothetical protein
MNYLRTAILLAGLTGLFMAVGYLIGGGSGAVIAFMIAAATNLFSYWNSDKPVLSMHDAHEVDESTAPELVGIVRELAQHAALPMPRGPERGRGSSSGNRTSIHCQSAVRPRHGQPLFHPSLNRKSDCRARGTVTAKGSCWLQPSSATSCGPLEH